MNRIETAIARVRETFATLPADKVESVDTSLALDFGEHFEYQEVQARAHVSGKLSTDEAQIVYAALGEVGSASNGGWAAGTDTATKYAVTLVIGELLKARIAARA
jgi:hypothetical protein